MSTTVLPAAPSVTEEALSVREQVRRALLIGGRARVTVTSRSSGRYLTVMLSAKKRGADGRFISRAKTAGRVGLGDADVLFADGSDNAFGEGCGRLALSTGEWLPPYGGTSELGSKYAWAARNVVTWALTDNAEVIASFDGQAEVVLASECCMCGKALNDPKSVERGVGPECFGKLTGSKHV